MFGKVLIVNVELKNISRNTIFIKEYYKIFQSSYVLQGLLCSRLTRALATRLVLLKVPGQQEPDFFSSFSFTGEFEHMVLFFIFLSFDLFFRWSSRASSLQSSNDDGCETTVLEHVLEKRNSSCPLLLLLTSTATCSTGLERNEWTNRTPPWGLTELFHIHSVEFTKLPRNWMKRYGLLYQFYLCLANFRLILETEWSPVDVDG